MYINVTGCFHYLYDQLHVVFYQDNKTLFLVWSFGGHNVF